jgi:hypothetical protein
MSRTVATFAYTTSPAHCTLSRSGNPTRCERNLTELLDNFVGDGEQCCRQGKAERLRGLSATSSQPNSQPFGTAFCPLLGRKGASARLASCSRRPGGVRRLACEELLSRVCSTSNSSRDGDAMGVRSMMATILKRELETRGIRSLRADECEEIIQRLLEQLTDLELSLPAREISETREK